jgi:hypothetical protein
VYVCVCLCVCVCVYVCVYVYAVMGRILRVCCRGMTSDCVSMYIQMHEHTHSLQWNVTMTKLVFTYMHTNIHTHIHSLRGDVALTIITMSISEGLIRQLNPKFDCVRNALPYFVRYRYYPCLAYVCMYTLMCAYIRTHTHI